MLKLLLCLICGVLLAVLMLHLRQQRLELNHQTNRLHNQIEARQARLWNQQLQIAAATAPSVLKGRIQQHHLPLWSDPRVPAPAGNWVASPTDLGLNRAR